MENHLEKKYYEEIDKIYLGNTRLLYRGGIRLKEAVRKNIDSYLSSSTLIKYGVSVNLSVTTKKGVHIYPYIFEEKDMSLSFTNPGDIADSNYILLIEGIDLKVSVKIGYNTLISNVLMASYIFIFGLLFYSQYRKGLISFRLEEKLKNEKIKELESREANLSEELNYLKQKRINIESHLADVKKNLTDKIKSADQTEEDLFAEIESFEKEINESNEFQEELLSEITDLKIELQEYRKSDKKNLKIRQKSIIDISKRFTILYKNTIVQDKAVDGYLDLSEDLMLKCEELIHKLNEKPDDVIIKRKVFGKKTTGTILEVIFGYKGRLYFQKNHENQIEVVLIGTKNTQKKDLDHLHKIR